MNRLPHQFNDRLKRIAPSGIVDSIGKSFRAKERFCVRINTLKVGPKEAFELLEKEGIKCQKMEAFADAITINISERGRVLELKLLKDGHIYLQNPSSMLVARILGPQENEKVLDMCAAPGSKTAHMAALMKNTGQIIAIEKVKKRFFKLKAVVERLGVSNCALKCLDGRRYRPSGFLFDKVLIDAPCSSEGRFSLSRPKSFDYWSLRKIKEMKRKQKGLLLRGLQLLKAGGTLVYSTCTFAPEENEEVVDWALRKTQGAAKLLSIDVNGVSTYSPLLQWGKKKYSQQINKCLRITPTGIWDGFFIAKFKRYK